MKFNLTSMFLTVALVAVCVGWGVSQYRHAEQLEVIRIKTEKDLRRAERDALRDVLTIFATGLTTGRSYDSYKMGIATFLVSEFEQLARSSTEADGEFFEKNCVAAGDILCHIGWDCETPDELEASLNEFSKRTNGNPPPVLTKEFSTKVLEAKSKFRKGMGSAAPQEPLTAGFYKLDDLHRQD